LDSTTTQAGLSSGSDLLRILLVEDDPDDVAIVRDQLRRQRRCNAEITDVDRWATARERLVSGHFDAVLLDLGLPDGDGADLVAIALADAGSTPIVIMTGREDDELAASAVRDGAQDYLVKGELGGDSLAKRLMRAIERRKEQEGP
jgi:DNA-binding response OmpR family regulator